MLYNYVRINTEQKLVSYLDKKKFKEKSKNDFCDILNIIKPQVNNINIILDIEPGYISLIKKENDGTYTLYKKPMIITNNKKELFQVYDNVK
jgi:hypothetical protein